MEKPIKNYTLLILLTLLFFACKEENDNGDNNEPSTIATLIEETSGLDSLAKALTLTQLIDNLDGNTNYTVFAPNNEAFTELLISLSLNSISEIPEPALDSIIQYHIVDGIYLSSDLSDELILTPINAETFTVNIDNGNVTLTDNNNQTINVTATDIEAKDGVIHLLDEVLRP